MSDKKDQDGRQVFRSVGAVVVWWIWLLFAVGNLIDLAVQGRDHLSLVAAFILLFVTGIVYVTALRPRIIADDDGADDRQPGPRPPGWLGGGRRGRPHRPAPHPVRVAGGDGTARRAIYSWAVHSSRRRQVAAEMRARRQSRQGSRGGFGGAGGMGGMGGFGLAAGFGSEPSPEGDPLRVDANKVVATLTERARAGTAGRTRDPGGGAGLAPGTWSPSRRSSSPDSPC